MARMLLILLVLCGCLADETISGYAPAGTTFVLQTINDTPFPARATLTFPQEGRIAGQAPCNSYSGAQTVPYPWFKVETIVATKRACPDLQAEQSFFEALSEMTLSEVSGTTLILSNDAGQKMIFTGQI